MGAIPAPVEDEEAAEPLEPSIAAPIQTVTMADLFVRQGHPEKAVSIYEKLLAVEPENESLRAKLDEARRALQPPDPAPAPTPESPVARAVAAPSGETEETLTPPQAFARPAAPAADDEPTEPPLGSAPVPWDGAPGFGNTAEEAPAASAAAAAPAPAATPQDAAAPIDARARLGEMLETIRSRRREPAAWPALAGKEP